MCSYIMHGHSEQHVCSCTVQLNLAKLSLVPGGSTDYLQLAKVGILCFAELSLARMACPMNILCVLLLHMQTVVNDQPAGLDKTTESQHRSLGQPSIQLILDWPVLVHSFHQAYASQGQVHAVLNMFLQK